MSENEKIKVGQIYVSEYGTVLPKDIYCIYYRIDNIVENDQYGIVQIDYTQVTQYQDSKPSKRVAGTWSNEKGIIPAFADFGYKLANNLEDIFFIKTI